LRDIINAPERVDIIGVKVKNKNLIPEAQEDIEKLLRRTRGVKEGEEDFSVQTPEAALESLNDILTGIQVFIAIIASISIIVGMIGIINTMLTAVLERKKQIGIMKAIGAKNSDIFYMFFIESGMMGLMGGLAGTIIGSLVAYGGTLAIGGLVGTELSPGINVVVIISALAGSFIIGALAGIVPAMRAASQHPVDALRD
jgi:putative ABC transport system permease protein